MDVGGLHIVASMPGEGARSTADAGGSRGAGRGDGGPDGGLDVLDVPDVPDGGPDVLGWRVHCAAGEDNPARLASLLYTPDLVPDAATALAWRTEEVDEGTPLHAACAHKPPSVACIEILLDAGAAIDPVDKFGRTPLMKVVRSCAGERQADEAAPGGWGQYQRAVDLLLERGADHSLVDGKGKCLADVDRAGLIRDRVNMNSNCT